jgi:hypothetical protein
MRNFALSAVPFGRHQDAKEEKNVCPGIQCIYTKKYELHTLTTDLVLQHSHTCVTFMSQNGISDTLATLV